MTYSASDTHDFKHTWQGIVGSFAAKKCHMKQAPREMSPTWKGALSRRYRAFLWRYRALWRECVRVHDCVCVCMYVYELVLPPTLTTWHVHDRYVGLFCGDTGVFCKDTGLFCGNLGLFCGDMSMFRRRCSRLDTHTLCVERALCQFLCLCPKNYRVVLVQGGGDS